MKTIMEVSEKTNKQTFTRENTWPDHRQYK